MLNRRHVIIAAVAGVLPVAATGLADVTRAQKLVSAAKSQIGQTLVYDPAYVKLDYPGGDVPHDRGVCTDVVIRAYRKGLGLDLQQLVHEDMAQAFAAYPRRWGLKSTDRNIDHRRVPNLATYFKRKRAVVATMEKPDDFQAGDLVTMLLPGNLPHIGIVSDGLAGDGVTPLVIHNIGRGTEEAEVLFRFPVTGHFRYAV